MLTFDSISTIIETEVIIVIQRETYINQLLLFKDKPFIKVLTGMRRVGKSTLIDLYISHLLTTGVTAHQILKINLELPQFFEIEDYRHLTKYVMDWSKDQQGPLYVFIDEVGRVTDWEKAVNGFHALNRFDLYITGSNADLLSSDLSTFLAGRYVEIQVMPLSFKEFKDVHAKSTFNDYLIFGGIPSIAPLNLHYESSMTVLRDSFRSAVLQDVISRHQLRQPVTLERLIQYIFSSTGKTFSALSISNYFKAQKMMISVDTILSYLSILEDAYLIYRIKRNDLIGKVILKTEEKYYIADHGFREAIAGNNASSIEMILENIVLIELKRRGFQVFIGKINDLEIDFVAKKENQIEYYQVSYLMSSQKTRSREFEVYYMLSDNYPKYVLSLDAFDFSKDGIIHKNIIDFLLE